MSDNSPLTNEAPAVTLARRRPRCPDCRDWMEWLWRCFCYTDEPTRVCDCEEHGVWFCLDCTTSVDVTEVSA